MVNLRNGKEAVAAGSVVPIDTSKLTDEGAMIVNCIVDYFEALLREKNEIIEEMESCVERLNRRVEKLEET